MAVTIKDVAREARVSVASVSRVLNGHGNVSDDTRNRIVSVAERLRYTPHSGARSLITRQTNTIGVLLPDMHGEFFSEIVRGIDMAARKQGLQLLVSSSHGDIGEIAKAIRAMSGRVDGLLIMSPHTDDDFLARNLPQGLPAVLMNTPSKSGQFSCLTVDSYYGAYAMVRHLVEGGHRRIAHIAGPEDNYDAQERLRGYRDALKAFVPDVPERVLKGDFSEESGCRAGYRLLALDDRPDAVFAANDMMAIGCLFAMTEAGLRVPQDIALAGFDDIPVARYVTPPLTTVRVQIADLGGRALERLTLAIEHPDHTKVSAQTLLPELVVRTSSTLLGSGSMGS